MNDRVLPFNRVYGIIAVVGNMGDIYSFSKTILNVLTIIPFADIYKGMKIRVSQDELSLRFIDYSGKNILKRMKSVGDIVYEWIDENEE
jgi:hypothetical protein